MSPALQANLEVERYIGSYLISQRIPPNVKTSPPKRYQNNHAKPKHLDTEKVQRNFNKYCFPPREHHVGGPSRYQMSPGQIPVPVDCQGYNNHYGKHNPGNSGWAGMPLISMTSGNRRNKKIPSPTSTNQIQKFPNKQSQQHNSFTKGKEVEENSQNDSDRSPLTRLAIHTQGAPLIQAGRYNNNSNNNRSRNNVHNQSTRVFRGEGVRWDPARDAKTNSQVQGKDQPCGNTDSSSVASDESSGNLENSLPRIIKPRKRRKKDRKPITGSSTSNPTPSETSQYSREPESTTETSLKTFLPIRFEPNAIPAPIENKSDLLSNNNHLTSFNDKQSEDLIDPLASADEFPLGNLLDDDEDDSVSELSSCAPATLCQCRYCDPSGVIWDVDQRCYSPFLTPPSPSDKPHFTTSIPLAYSPVSRSYNRQISVVESPSHSPSHYSFSGELATLLRRSWSDPSSNKKPVKFQSPNSECRRDSRPSSPGLQVSSEIVTSPNGHRDIEIKFYSSSSPPDSSKSKFSASFSDRDQNERYFVVEE